jgi:hypothetical protein
VVTFGVDLFPKRCLVVHAHKLSAA